MTEPEDPREYPADHTSECDRCHNDGLAVWIDHSEAGEFEYCHKCWGWLLGVKRRAARRELRKRNPVGIDRNYVNPWM